MMFARLCASAIWKSIFAPATTALGLVSQRSKFASSQVKPEFLSAIE
jgi:hypothetical protein